MRLVRRTSGLTPAIVREQVRLASLRARTMRGCGCDSIGGLSGAADTMLPGDSLSRGQRLVSPGGVASAEMQSDGNFVVYDLRNGARAPLWQSTTVGSGATAIMQTDGNLVVYDAGHTPRWAAATNGKGAGLRAIVQDDGNFVIYDGSHRAVWSTHTDGFHDQRFPPSGNPFADAANAVGSAFSSLPTPLVAVFAPQALITQFAYEHPESIPLFGPQAAQAKAAFVKLQNGGVDAGTAANIAAQALGPDVAPALSTASAALAQASPLAAQVLASTQSTGGGPVGIPAALVKPKVISFHLGPASASAAVRAPSPTLATRAAAPAAGMSTGGKVALAAGGVGAAALVWWLRKNRWRWVTPRFARRLVR